MCTQRIFDDNSHEYAFDAHVLACSAKGDRYEVILDRTAFFPEGGGQAADTGFIGEAAVIDVQESGRVITHLCDRPVSGDVHCEIDREKRFSRMQQHSGEHVFSGIIHSLTGADNVGFHMGEEYMTIDFSLEIADETLRKAERLANEAVYADRRITCRYPSPAKLNEMEYRSKLELTENVRIVEIEGIDRCACCAPHVLHTGEIGLIKLIGSMRHRGGTRVFLSCGRQALDYICAVDEQNARIGELLSAKRGETYAAVAKLNDDHQSEKQKNALLRRSLAKLAADNAKVSGGALIVFCEGFSMDDLREAVNFGSAHAPMLTAALCGDDEEGYMYVIKSETLALPKLSREINSALNGRGGGRGDMIQGRFLAKKENIIDYLHSLLP